MYERILIATDGSELAGKGLAHGLALAHPDGFGGACLRSGGLRTHAGGGNGGA